MAIDGTEFSVSNTPQILSSLSKASTRRLKAASEAGCEVVRISFGKTLVMVRSLWLVLAAGNGIISGKQASALTERVMALLADATLPERRKRSCPRKIRQPVSSWTRLTENSCEIGEIECEVLNAYA